MRSDERACFSSTGPDVEIAAPGVSINSTRIGSGYMRLSGTSMASPHVAGVAALVIASGVSSSAEARARLADAADDLGLAGRDSHFGFGLVDPNEAITALPPNIAPVVTITSPASGVRFDTDATITLTGTAVDAEDGDLSSDLEWTSDLDGPLGTGGSLSTTLSEGVHTTQISASDTAGEADSDSILVTITSPPLPDDVRVASISYSTRDLGRRRNPLDVTVRVVDAAGRRRQGRRPDSKAGPRVETERVYRDGWVRDPHYRTIASGLLQDPGATSTREWVDVGPRDSGKSVLPVGRGLVGWSMTCWLTVPPNRCDELLFDKAEHDGVQPLLQIQRELKCPFPIFAIFRFSTRLAEGLLKAEGRGAIAAFSPTGLSLNTPAHRFHKAL